MGKLDDVRIVKMESLDNLSNEYSFRTPSGIEVTIDTVAARKGGVGKFQESLHAYSIEKDGIGYALHGGGLTQRSIDEVRASLAKQKDIPAPIRNEFNNMLDKAKVAPEPKRKIQMI